MASINLIVGLGNPGPRYAETRHNAGFWFVDALAVADSAVWREEARFLGEVTRVRINSAPNRVPGYRSRNRTGNAPGNITGNITEHGTGSAPECLLLKPHTFMNRSGSSVQKLAAYYRIPPESILVVHDDLDLPPGTVRLKRGGGHGGHNGLRDIHQHLGPEYARLRVGIGHPGVRAAVLNYVLDRPSRDDFEVIVAALNRAAMVIVDAVRGDWDRAVHALHSQTVSEGPEKTG